MAPRQEFHSPESQVACRKYLAFYRHGDRRGESGTESGILGIYGGSSAQQQHASHA